MSVVEDFSPLDFKTFLSSCAFKKALEEDACGSLEREQTLKDREGALGALFFRGNNDLNRPFDTSFLDPF